MFDEEEDREYEGYLQEDLEKLDAYLKGEPFGYIDSDRWEVMIDHLLMSAQYKNALICAEEASAQFSYNPLFKLRKAQCFSALGKLKEAVHLLTELERTGVVSFELLLTKASVFSQLKDSVNAIKYFRHALDLAEEEDKDEVFLDLAMEYENKGDFKSALKVLNEAIQHNPNNEAAIYEVAFCYDQMGEYEKAIQCYSDFIDENPYSFTSWYNLGNAYLKLEEYDKAIWAYDYCILINDDFGPVYFNLGNAFLAQDKFIKAIENFHKCIELDGDDPMALCYIGECHEQLKEYELAKHFYNRSLELAPLLPDAWLGLGIVEDLEGNTREGIVLINKAAELDPENAGIYQVLAGAHEKLGEDQEASDYYQLAIAFDPADEDILTDYIQFLSTFSMVEALDYLDNFEKTNPKNEVVPVLKVNILWQLGRKSEAIELFKWCVENNRKKAVSLFTINPDLNNVPEFVLLADK